MPSVCPHCHQPSLVANDLETLTNAVALPFTRDRIQQCCQNCGWMETEHCHPEQFFVNSPPQKISSP